MNDTNREVNAAQREKCLKEFTAAVSRFEAAQLRQLFISPARGYKKMLAGLDAESKRAYENAQEEHVRSETARKDFKRLSELASDVFPKLKRPMLNRELKEIVIAALEAYYVETKNESTPLKIRVLKNAKIMASSFFATPLVPKDKGEEDESVKNLQGVRAIVETHPAIARADGSLNKSNILPIIDSLEKPILDSLKKFGFTRIDRTESTRRIIKDEKNFIDVEKNGTMRSNHYNINDNEKHNINGMVNSFLGMIDIYLQVALKHGNDLAFPSGAINIKVELSPGATPANKAVVDHVLSMVEVNLKNALCNKKYDLIRSRLMYEGKEVLNENPLGKSLKQANPPSDDSNKRQVFSRDRINSFLRGSHR